MVIFLNGQFVPAEQAVISVFDRGFLYGDGLFETLRVFNGKPFRWTQHRERLERGAEFLKIKLPFPRHALRGLVEQLISRNQMPDALLRVTLSRGVGIRGYSPTGAENPTLVMSLHPAAISEPGRADLPVGQDGPQRVPTVTWKLVTSSFRIPANEPLAQYKTCNKLPQILARAEADAAGADEALLLNTDGFVVEAASSNLFWIEGNTVCTPPLAGGILAGVTRAVVLEICDSLGVKVREDSVTTDELKRRDGVFLSLSSWGVVEAQSLDGLALKQSPLTEQIRLAYGELVRAETA
jgi:branched-chain amino acid aminotransferase